MLFFGFFVCILFFISKADLNDGNIEIIAQECEKYDLTDGDHYLKSTQNDGTSIIFHVNCENGNMIISSDYLKDANDPSLTASLSPSSLLEGDISIADDSLESGINPIDDGTSSNGKWKSQTQYIIFLIIIIMISMFGIGFFFCYYIGVFVNL